VAGAGGQRGLTWRGRSAVVGGWSIVRGGGRSTGSHQGGIDKARERPEESVDGRGPRWMKKTTASSLRGALHGGLAWGRGPGRW
jgi:hypothetical protein